MPDVTITTSPALKSRLEAYVQQVNARSGGNLTLEEWALRHWKELVTNSDLNVQVSAIQADLEAERERRIQTARQNLINTL